MKYIKQVIVVEGKTDTQKLQKIFGSDTKTFETQGLHLNPQIFSFLNFLNKQHGIIVFTDPDYPGQKIRNIINKKMNKPVLNAFINNDDFDLKKRKKGVAEASELAIKKALSDLILFKNNNNPNLTWDEYIYYGFYLKKNRIKIAKKFNWPQSINSKTLFKWLNWVEYDFLKVEKIIKEN